MTETKPLPEYLKKAELISQQISELNKNCSVCICNKNHQEIHNDALFRAWELTQERVEKAEKDTTDYFHDGTNETVKKIIEIYREVFK